MIVCTSSSAMAAESRDSANDRAHHGTHRSASRRPAHRLASVATLVAMIAGASSTVSAAPLDPATVAGVYKHRFPNGSVFGEKWISENILEIDPVTPTSAYFKAHFEFFNGHQCGLHGVADVEGDALVYRDRAEDASAIGGRCVLTLRVTARQLIFEDPDQLCKQMYCGVRGGWNGITIERRTRRPIRYLELLIHSDDYWNARIEHDAPRAPSTDTTTPPAPR